MLKSFKRYIALHLGLEWQSMKGLYGYYNNARFRDALLAGMFYQQDRLSEKYYSFSNYHYGKNNPNRYTDISGDSVAILNFQQSKNQHIGLLIQDNKQMWGYFSVNGNNMYMPGYFTGNEMGVFIGGNTENNLGEYKFNSVTEFLESDYNRANYNHDDAFIMPTSSKQDNIIEATFKEEIMTEYNPFTNNCATAEANSLNAAGIHTHRGNNNKLLNIKINSYIPSRLYKDIKKHNKGVRLVK